MKTEYLGFTIHYDETEACIIHANNDFIVCDDLIDAMACIDILVGKKNVNTVH